MKSIDRPFVSVRGAVRLALLGAVLLPAQSVLAAEQGQEIEEVVVTGFRGSLNTALAVKRNETAAIDVIAAEDIGKFPDSNLAESMQRVPGVTLSRGDGGEGRNISVRGLGPQFTRVRINGMEGAAQTGSSDIYGAGNNGRAFDFNVFPTEIFSQLAVRKTPSADVEEGSLGATVDLKAPRPFDTDKETVFTMTARGVYNNISEDVDPRASMLFSKKFFDDTFGVLASVAYQSRNIREVGYSAVDVLSANTNGLSVGGVLDRGPAEPGHRHQGCVGHAVQHQQPTDRHGRCVPDRVGPAARGFADDRGQRRFLPAPAALRELRAGHAAHRRHVELPVAAQ